MNVLACVISRDVVPAFVVDALARQTWPCDWVLSRMQPTTSHPNPELEKIVRCARHRERARRFAVASRADACWFLDADVLPADDCLERLVRLAGRGREVIAAPYRVAGPSERPWCFGGFDVDGRLQLAEELPEEASRVQFLPLGCTLVLRSCLRRLPVFSGAFEWLLRSDGSLAVMDEGADFARRAAAAGFGLWVEPAAAVEHRWESGRRPGFGVDG
jgi:GT2 family glycosyltransferase